MENHKQTEGKLRLQKNPKTKPTPPKNPKQQPKPSAWCLNSSFLKMSDIPDPLCEVLCSQQDEMYQVEDMIRYDDEQIPNNSYFWTSPASPWVNSLYSRQPGGSATFKIKKPTNLPCSLSIS